MSMTEKPNGLPGDFTRLERKALDALTEAANALAAVCKDGGDPGNGKNDFGELAGHIHILQSAVMSNVAARLNPGFRVLGGSPSKVGGG